MKLPLACIFCLMFFLSCEEEEDPALVETYQDQQVVLKELQEELSRVRKEIERTQIKDPAPDLRQLEREIKEVKEEKEDLLSKIEALKGQKKAKQDKFEKYQKDYPVRTK